MRKKLLEWDMNDSGKNGRPKKTCVRNYLMFLPNARTSGKQIKLAGVKLKMNKKRDCLRNRHALQLWTLNDCGLNDYLVQK